MQNPFKCHWLLVCRVPKMRDRAGLFFKQWKLIQTAPTSPVFPPKRCTFRNCCTKCIPYPLATPQFSSSPWEKCPGLEVFKQPRLLYQVTWKKASWHFPYKKPVCVCLCVWPVISRKAMRLWNSRFHSAYTCLYL